jgi:3-methyladenine DNA glycosylase AlkC
MNFYGKNYHNLQSSPYLQSLNSISKANLCLHALPDQCVRPRTPDNSRIKAKCKLKDEVILKGL